MRATKTLRLHISHGPYFDTSAQAAKSLAAEIGDAIRYNGNRGDVLKTHREAVNLELCTSAADLLAPSLQQFRGCHIIDANPGAGLWSSTINNLLRPKRHVLVESDARFDPFLDRLLQSDPSYTRVRYCGGDSQSLARVIDEGLVPRPQPSQDPSKPTTSLLILFNMTRARFGRTRANSRLVAREATIDLCRNAWLRTGVQKYGPVRVLAWVEEAVKDATVPRSVSGNLSSIASQRYATHVHVVAEDGRTARDDWGDRMEWESTWDVLKRMEAAGIQIPENRQNPLQKTLLRLGEDWPRTFEHIMSVNPVNFAPLKLPAVINNKIRLRRKYAPLVRDSDELMRLERLAVDDNQPERLRLAAREDYEKRHAEFQRAVSSLPRAAQNTVWQDLDRQTTKKRDPPGLPWDRRPFEPVDCTKKDFFSHNGDVCLSLLDMCPRGSAQQHGELDLQYWDRLVNKLMGRPTETVATRFNGISPGAAEHIIPKLSALHDPLRYGSLHPEHFRIRLMTIEMLEEVVQVWKSWPSRPRHIDAQLLAIDLERD
ncbi:uncharacterized protein IWZ02DRAFT_139489 [Phyllosticta citriasiana]|uniref:Mitochondrial transcription factor 1 n=1 Tax=Phyllosticta citriasiana TaxID=595635 RepID=A0ABR1KTW7_9PEZI